MIMEANPAGRILIVDDDNNFRSSMRRILHFMPDIAGELVTAGDGEEAMKIVLNDHVDCVLMDYHMPNGTGLEWLKRMLDVKPDQAIVMVTGAGNEEIAVDAMKNGAMDYLVKGSINPDSLRRAVKNAVERIRLRQTIKRQNEELMEAEGQRVMIESLGAACHLLGQPATVITTYLDLMKRRESSPEMQDMINNCMDSAVSIAEILDRLRSVSSYRTEPYRPAEAGEAPRCDEHILKV
jgi:DNA-binding NtrC family response regulator